MLPAPGVGEDPLIPPTPAWLLLTSQAGVLNSHSGFSGVLENLLNKSFLGGSESVIYYLLVVCVCDYSVPLGVSENQPCTHSISPSPLLYLLPLQGKTHK